MTDSVVPRRVLLGSAASVAFAMRSTSSGGAQARNVLRARSYADMQVIDPGFTLAAPEGDIARCLFRSLVRSKSGTSWQWELDAAEKIEQLSPTTIAFALRSGIKWTNGFGDMTADDVKFSFERIVDPTMQSPYHDDWSTLVQVEVTGPLSGVIHLNKPFAPLWASTLPWNAGMILCRKAVEGVGGKFTTRPPAVSGPYLLKEWQPKQLTILVRNSDYTGPPPAFDEIHIIPIEDPTTAEIGFAAQELDITNPSVSSLPTLRKNPPNAARLQVRPSIAFTWVGMNIEAPPFDDIRVRRAVQQTIDVDAILQAVYFGEAQRATGIIAPSLLGHRDAPPLPRNVDAAKRLLAEAGKARGFRCSIDVLNIAENLTAAQIIQANLAELAIEVEINAHDSGTYWSLGDQSKGDQWKQINLLLQRYTMAPDPSWATAWFVPAQIGIWNWERWNSPPFGALHEAALVEMDPARRAAMYVRMQELMEESGAYLFLTHEVSSVMYRNAIVPGLMPDARYILPDMKRA
jgi:peptide/nickel transport system substrate-binding protein